MKKPQKPKVMLKVAGPRDEKLGRDTIMDRALAARYGAAYVHLAAFTIDVDRVRELEAPDLPFAWEVYLTECQLEQLMDTAVSDPKPMLEEMCLAILELPRPRAGEQGPFGSQLPFAIYTAVARKIVPPSLGQCFANWKKPPADLIEEVEAMASDPGLKGRLAKHCLTVQLSPPLAPPAREALELLAR
jgi:hypothetical protein